MILFIGAAGAVTRLISRLLRGKDHDPAVLVLDPKGQWIIPLLGGHSSGAEQLAREYAADLGGEAVLTGAAASQQRLALDQFGKAWGWKRGGRTEAWRQLMQQQARGQMATIEQNSGLTPWRNSANHPLLAETVNSTAHLSIGPDQNSACRWHPACAWIGVGCERNTSLSLVERAVDKALEEAEVAIEAVAGIASADRKADEAALLTLVKERQWAFRTFCAEELNQVAVPTPSERVRDEMGTASVAEAAALLASGQTGKLRQNKRIERAACGEQGAATLAIAISQEAHAPQRGELHLIGSGPGDLSLLSTDARHALTRCVAWVGYSLYLDLLEPLRRIDQARIEGQLTREWDRCAEALAMAQQGAKVALISSGDSGIYGMAGLALELWLQQPQEARPSFEVHPGISALQLAAARVGAPLMHDFCTISLSDRLTPWPVIEQRLTAAAEGDFVVALYNPRSKGRDWQLGRAQELLLNKRDGSTPVAVARQLGRVDEKVSLTTLDALDPLSIDMLTLILVGNSSTYVMNGRMATPRGYPGSQKH